MKDVVVSGNPDGDVWIINDCSDERDCADEVDFRTKAQICVCF